MAVEMKIWKMSGHRPVPLEFGQPGFEQRLEDMVASDPSLVGADLLVVGRQVKTDFGGRIDVLGVDAEGHVHALELKRARTPRDVVAQLLDYGAWVQDLTVDDVAAIFAQQHDGTFAEAFAERFATPIPDVFNPDQQLTIVASELDAVSERIVGYLAQRYYVPINAVFFRYFADGDHEYLARTWLIAPEKAEAKRPQGQVRGKVRAWNGRDFYAVLGNDRVDRWEAAGKYGFVGAGGGSWYWKPLRHLTPGKRVFAYVGGAGYVGVGEVIGPLTLLRDLEVVVDGSPVKVVDQPELAKAVRDRAWSDDDEVTEFAVPVNWLVRRSVADAVSERGLFASQVTVCKLRDDRTIDVVTQAFGLERD